MNEPSANATADGQAHERTSMYFTPAAEGAMLWEQIEFLLGHVSPNCTADCPDCRRLEGARRYLLQPFE